MVNAQPKKSKEDVKADKLKRKELRRDNLGIEPKEKNPYKKVAKKKKRSKLDIEKSKPNSKYWRAKCDSMFMTQCRGKPCAVCGTIENTCFHHIILKGRCKAMRYDLVNVIVLCNFHHCWSNEIAPHSKNPFAVARFIEWLQENHKMKYDYCIERQHWNRQFKFKEVYEIFLEQKKNGDAIQF